MSKVAGGILIKRRFKFSGLRLSIFGETLLRQVKNLKQWSFFSQQQTLRRANRTFAAFYRECGNLSG